jgi:hypothetical protein
VASAVQSVVVAGINGVQEESRTWRASGVSMMAAAVGAVTSSNEAGRDAGVWTSSRRRYILCIVTLNLSQLIGQAKVSRTAVNVFQDSDT